MTDTRLPLPPRRALPPDVRERMRRRVLAAEPGRRRGPVIAAAAAAVVLLAGGGVYLTRDGGSPPVAPPATSARQDPTKIPTTYGKPHDSDIAKCDGMPSTVAVTMPGRRILVGDGRFCEITYTKVVVSTAGEAPVPIGDSGASVLWWSPSGVIVGQAPKGSETIELAPEPGMGGDEQKIAELLPGGLFVLRTTFPTGQVSFRVGTSTTTARIDKRTLTRPDPATSKDSWPSGMSDPNHPDNLVARCFDLWMTGGPPFTGTPASFDGPAGWQPTLLVGKTDALGVLVLHKGSDTAYCGLRDGVLTDFHWPNRRDGDTTAFALLSVSSSPEAGLTVLAGTANPRVVTRLEFTGPGGAHAEAEMGVDTFAASLAEGAGLPDITMKVVGKRGEVLYEGPAG